MKRPTLLRGLFFLTPVVFVVVVSALLSYQNHVYTDDSFSGVVPYDEVLASRRWQPFFMENPLNCTYAVVSLCKNAASQPPSGWPHESPNWVETPIVYPANSLEIVSPCLDNFSPETRLRLETATKTAGSYYWRYDSEVTYLYSQKENIAAYIRYGD